jgi:glycerol dehydrogenase
MTIGLKGPGLYIQGEGELDKLGKYVRKMGHTFLLICSPNNQKRIGGRIAASLQQAEKTMVYYQFGGECSKAAIQTAVEAAQAAGCDGIIGAGGGKAIDTAKAVGTNMGGLPVIIIPTIASNDSPCAGVAVIYNEQGVVVKALMMRRNPDLVLVDTGIIAGAPKKYLISGMGDALSTYFEARACRRSGAKTMARGMCSATALTLAKLCYDILLQHSVQALEAVEQHTVTPELEAVVEACVYLSGVGFECGGLAAAHAVNDGLAHVPQAHGASHGEKVAFGLLVQLQLEKASQEEWDTVLRYIRQIGLPSCLADLGIADIRDEDIRAVASASTVPTQFTKNVRADITPDEVYAAILAADTAGAHH